MKWQKIFVLLVMSLLISCNQETSTQLSEPAQKQLYFIAKSGAAVSMAYEVMNPVMLAQATNINLEFKVGRQVEILQVTYHIESGFRAVMPQTSFTFTSLAKGAVEQLVLGVMPEQVGEHIIHIYAEVIVDGASHSKAFIVPITVISNGSQAKQFKASKSPSNSGMQYLPVQNVISMPAEESAQ